MIVEGVKGRKDTAKKTKLMNIMYFFRVLLKMIVVVQSCEGLAYVRVRASVNK